MNIHPDARIAPSATLGRDVQVGAFASVGPQVTLGDGCIVEHGALIAGNTAVGARNRFFPCCAVGTVPQDLKYHGEDTRLEIGDDNVFREFVTVNTGTVNGGGVTRLGSRCFIMACAHVAHDCTVEDDVILANSVLLGGHICVEAGAKLMGNASVNPFTTIGRLAYVGGLSRIVQDVPPFSIVEGHPAKVRGINVVGCERAGLSPQTIESLRRAYVRIFRTRDNRSKILDEIARDPDAIPEVVQFAAFMRRAIQGKFGRYRESLR